MAKAEDLRVMTIDQLDDELIKLIRLQLLAGGEHADGDGQVKTRPLFFDVGGREIDGRTTHREFVARIGQRGGDAVAGFLHSGVGQSHDNDERVAEADIDLDLDRVSLDPVDSR